MSRSRRAPIWTEGYGNPDKKKRKQQANKRVKAESEVASGAAYKKVSDSWNICDYKFEDKKTRKREENELR